MRTLVEFGLANALAATLLAIVAMAVGTVVRRPAVRNALWLLVLVRLIVPPMWTVPVAWPASWGVADSPVEIPAEPMEEPELIPTAIGPVAEPDWFDEAFLAGLDAVSVKPLAAKETDAAPAVSAPTGEATVPEWPSLFAVIALLWGLGTAFVLGRSAWRIARFRWALRDAPPAPADLQAVADGLAAAMGLTWSPRVLLVPGRVWPSLWMPGVRSRKAKVIVPAGLLPLLDADQRAAVLAHELAHLRRGDPWVRWLELLVCGLYWWYPLLGWFRRQLRESEEECCDMWVVAALAGRRAYATALVETAVFLGGPDRVPAPILASGAGPVRDLQRRVTMIMRATWPARLTRLGLLAVLCLGTAGLAFGPVLAQEKPDEGKKDPPPAKTNRRDAPPRDPNESPDPRPKVRLERASDEEIEKAQEEVDKARRAMQKASEKLRAAEQKLAKAEGRPANQGPGGFGGFPGGGGGFGGFPGTPGGGGGFPGGGNRDGGFTPAPGGSGSPPPPGQRPGGEGSPGSRGGSGGGSRPSGPGEVGPGGGFGGNNEFRDLQKQMAELRQQLEEMRRELRENRAGGGDSPRKEPKDGPKRPRGGADNLSPPTPPPPPAPIKP